MDLLARLAPRYQRILDTCEPFLITWRGNHSSVNWAPFGVEIPAHRRYCPTRLNSRGVIDGLHALDGFSFGPQEMRMPRWVLFDCGEFPGIVFGFGRRAGDLPEEARVAYEATEDDDAFVPLSMWVAIRNLEEGAFFGHNLSSANLILKSEPLPGLGILTKAFGIAASGVRKQYGATQWDSKSLNVHLTYGEMALLSAYTPAHTHIETFSYLLDVDLEAIKAALSEDWARPKPEGTRTLMAGDTEAIKRLHADLEAGERWALIRAERRESGPQRLHLKRL